MMSTLPRLHEHGRRTWRRDLKTFLTEATAPIQDNPLAMVAVLQESCVTGTQFPNIPTSSDAANTSHVCNDNPYLYQQDSIYPPYHEYQLPLEIRPDLSTCNQIREYHQVVAFHHYLGLTHLDVNASCQTLYLMTNAPELCHSAKTPTRHVPHIALQSYQESDMPPEPWRWTNTGVSVEEKAFHQAKEELCKLGHNLASFAKQQMLAVERSDVMLLPSNLRR